MSEAEQQLGIPEGWDALEPPQDRTEPLAVVLDRFKTGFIQTPPHQRKPDAWDLATQRRYVARLKRARSGSHPPGLIATYQLVHGGKGSLVWLNDGLQRLTTLKRLQAEPERFEMDIAGVESLLRQSISVQHRHYESHEMAMEDFQLINDGKKLTPYELCHGYLDYMPHYEDVWEPLLMNISQTMKQVEARLAPEDKRSREERHKHERDDLALFLRFLIKDKDQSQYQDVGRTSVADLIAKGEVVEMQLRDEMIHRGADLVRSEVKKFCNFITRETATIEAIRDEELEAGVALNRTLYRWLLAVAIWRRSNNKPSQAIYRQFVQGVVTNFKSSSQVRDEETGRARAQVALAHLGLLRKVAEAVGMPDFCEPQPRQRSRRRMARPGYQDSHKMPFSVHGEGETFMEPANENMARGAKPVEPRERR